MTTRTRYFVIISLVVLAVGVGASLVAYYVGFPTSAATQAGGPDELQLVPPDATLVAYVNVRDIMVSDLRQRLLAFVPLHGDGHQEFQDRTGIDIEADIDSVIAVVVPPANPAVDEDSRASGLVLARGRFDEERIEALMRERGAAVEDYLGTRLIAADRRFAVAFPEPGLAAVGSPLVVRHALELNDGGDSVLTNDDIMNLVRGIDSGNAWAVGRFDSLTAQAGLPQDLELRLPSITWFTASAYINGGAQGILRAEAADEESAAGMREVVVGLLAFARLQSASRPEFQTLLDAIQLGGTGTAIALSFDISATLLDQLIQSRGQTLQ